MSNQGFIFLHRSLLDWEWYDEPKTTHLFIYCLLKANHKDNKWRGTDIKAGSFVTSLDKISSETGLSVQEVRTAIRKLEKTGELTSKNHSKNRMLSIVYWSKYQAQQQDSNKELTGNQQEDNKQSTGNQQFINSSSTTNNNDNNIYNKKNTKKDFVLPDWIDVDVWNDFEEFRKSEKKPMTDRSKRLNVKELARIKADTGDNPNDVLNQSIRNSWTGVFPIKQNSTKFKEKQGSNNSASLPKDWEYLNQDCLDNPVALDGEVIKLRQRVYDKWLKIYPNVMRIGTREAGGEYGVGLFHYLEKCDQWLADKGIGLNGDWVNATINFLNKVEGNKG